MNHHEKDQKQEHIDAMNTALETLLPYSSAIDKALSALGKAPGRNQKFGIRTYDHRGDQKIEIFVPVNARPSTQAKRAAMQIMWIGNHRPEKFKYSPDAHEMSALVDRIFSGTEGSRRQVFIAALERLKQENHASR